MLYALQTDKHFKDKAKETAHPPYTLTWLHLSMGFNDFYTVKADENKESFLTCDKVGNRNSITGI